MPAFESALSALERPASALLLDGWIAPVLSARALAADSNAVVLRALEAREGPGEVLGDLAGGARFGPWPPRHWLIALSQGEIRAVSLRGGDVERWVPTAVEIVSSMRSWRSGGASPYSAEAEVRLASGRKIVVGLAVCEDEDAARREVGVLARAVAGALDLPGPATSDGESDLVGEPSDDIVVPLARLSIGLEAERLVLRDHDGPDPKKYLGAYRVAAALFAVVAVGLWATLGIEAQRAGVGALLGTGALALVSSIAAYAFFEIARFTARYDADSVALAWFGADRVVVAPWVSRRGAIDTRPMGRFGSAIRTAEIQGCSSLEKDGMAAIELSTEHGPIEVVRLADAGAGVAFAKVIERTIATVAAPEKKKTALMRAKARRA
jgi:hypothetical protein